VLITNHIVDLDNGDVFELKLTFATDLFVGQPMTRVIWDVMPQISVRLGSPEHCSQLFTVLEEAGDFLVAAMVIRMIFQD
jgi:hypothetical protein